MDIGKINISEFRHWLLQTSQGFLAACGIMLIIGLMIILQIIDAYHEWKLVHTTSGVINPIHIPHKKASTVAIKDLPKLHVFGKGPQKGKKPYLPVSQLQLELTGVIFTGNSETSTVIIQVAGGKGKPYKVGDNIIDGVELNEIMKNGVILKNQGHLEKLGFKRENITFKKLGKGLWDR